MPKLVVSYEIDIPDTITVSVGTAEVAPVDQPQVNPLPASPPKVRLS